MAQTSRRRREASSGNRSVTPSPNSMATLPVPVGSVLEQIVGCKWSLRVLDLARRGTTRPGAMERATPGLSSKVLYQRLRKLERLGVLERVSYPDPPLRVEYRISPAGHRLLPVLDAIADLAAELDQAPAPATATSRAEVRIKRP